MSISLISQVSSKSVSVNYGSSSNEDSLAYKAVLNEALNSLTNSNSKDEVDSGKHYLTSSVSYTYTQASISLYQSADVNASSLATFLSSTKEGSNGINATKPSKYGYNIDENGFFGADFNKDAGLPASFRVNTEMMETAQMYSSEYKKASPMQVLAQAWKVFQEVCGGKLNMDEDGYVSTQSAKELPRSYTAAGGIFGKLLRVHNTQEEDCDEARRGSKVLAESNNQFYTGFSNLTFFDGNKQKFDDQVKNRIGADYGDNAPEGKIAVGQLFAVYFNREIKSEAQDYDVAVNRSKAFYDFLGGNQSFSSYFKSTHSNDDIKKALEYWGSGYFDHLDNLAAHFKDMMLGTMLNESGSQV